MKLAGKTPLYSPTKDDHWTWMEYRYPDEKWDTLSYKDLINSGAIFKEWDTGWEVQIVSVRP